MSRLWFAVLLWGLASCWGGRRGDRDKTEKAEKTEKSDKAEKSDKPEKSDKDDDKHKTLHKQGGDVEPTSSTVTAPPVVVFIVLDTVRADHTALCGYNRPNTPFLQKLVEKGAVFTCEAYAPGTWTLPSHASYFTGKHTTEHNVLNKGIPLDPEQETLAEIFAASGYQTVLVSANPTLSKESGIWQGFQRVNVPAKTTNEFRGNDFDEVLEKGLKGMTPDKPLFLTINIFDAHDPYPAVPGDVGWVPKRASLQLNPDKEDQDGAVHRWLDGRMPEEERKEFLAHIQDTYDYGIWRADRNVQRAIQVLEKGGWMEQGFRVVIASDHGEHIGDHDMIRHDGPPWEAVTRVPVMFFDSTFASQPALPAPFSATQIFWLLRDGKLPDPLLPVASASIAYEKEHSKARADGVAVWSPTRRKTLWIDGESAAYDLPQDPGEMSPLAVDAAEKEALQQRATELLQSKSIALGRGQDPAMMEMLQKVGYVD